MRGRGLLITWLVACHPPAKPSSPPVAAPMAVAPAPIPAPAPVSDDRDLDGVPDTQDRCPDEPEDHDLFEDSDGCVDRDNDRDGILDAHEFKDGRWTNCDYKHTSDYDEDCRNMPEDFDGVDDHDGCPDVLKFVCGSMKLPFRLQLDRRGQLTIDAKQMDELVATMIAASNTKFWVEAHIDKQRSPTSAKRITQSVAQEVVEVLVARGVARERLEPIGLGDTHPNGLHNTTAGRALDRRVEFTYRDPFAPTPVVSTQAHECR
ncbi:MAG: OmpA family protein [Nannocystis sp.]|nr:OmpA family protein [Nannocystis sp.]MBA3550495.1 OmpA family protein [Nannocystis sp.]